jgi:hypothetical protein
MEPMTNKINGRSNSVSILLGILAGAVIIGMLTQALAKADAPTHRAGRIDVHVQVSAGVPPGPGSSPKWFYLTPRMTVYVTTPNGRPEGSVTQVSSRPFVFSLAPGTYLVYLRLLPPVLHPAHVCAVLPRVKVRAGRRSVVKGGCSLP